MIAPLTLSPALSRTAGEGVAWRARLPLTAHCSFHKLRQHLRSGGIIAYATESCYGLGCDPRNARAVKRILQIKSRPQKKGLILIAANIRQLLPYVTTPGAAQIKILKQSWPGPTTFLMAASKRTPRGLRGQHQKIAVRVTAHPDAAGLCAALGMALVSTSANKSGLRPSKNYRDCVKNFGGSVMVLPGRIGKRNRPSTIKDLESGRITRR